MKVGVDHYSFHRFFGEIYPEQTAPDRNMTVEDFINTIADMGCEGITLESCFIPRFDKDYLSHLKGLLDEHRFDRVWVWGHPDGLEGGRDKAAYDEMIRNLEYAKAVGADVMKVVGASLMFRFEPHEPMLEKLAEMFSDAAAIAKDYGIKLAVENHIDFNPDEMLTLIENVDSPFFGINFDTGNFLRLLSDPVRGMEKLGKYVLSTHIKDLKPIKGVPVDEWYFFACTPVGDGLVDNKALVDILKKNNYSGFLAMEIDFLHPDYNNDELSAVKKGVAELKRIST